MMAVSNVDIIDDVGRNMIGGKKVKESGVGEAGEGGFKVPEERRSLLFGIGVYDNVWSLPCNCNMNWYLQSSPWQVDYHLPIMGSIKIGLCVLLCCLFN